MTRFVAAAGLVVAVRLEDATMQMGEAGPVDRLLEEVLQVQGRHQLDAIVAEAFGDPDQGEDSRHRAFGAVA